MYKILITQTQVIILQTYLKPISVYFIVIPALVAEKKYFLLLYKISFCHFVVNHYLKNDKHRYYIQKPIFWGKRISKFR